MSILGKFLNHSFFILFLLYAQPSHAIIPFGFIRKTNLGVDCSIGNPTPGTLCLGGTIFLGTLSSGATSGTGTDKYMTTPGGCGDIPAAQKVTGVNTPSGDYPSADFIPTCSGTDSLTKYWNDGSGNVSIIPGLADFTVTAGIGQGTSNTDLNYGNANTLHIVAVTAAASGGYHAAARYCDKLNYGGYTDWYLPNRFELNLFWNNKPSIPGLDTTGNYYWSSTEYNYIYLWSQKFTDGQQGYNAKYDANRVRCVRRIDPCAQTTPTPGVFCNDGTFYVGTINGYKYRTTPGGCTDSATPACGNKMDTLTKSWGTNGTLTNQSSLSNGPGNSSYIATNYGDTYAAKYCENLVYAGYSDWFLPAKDELYLFFSQAGSRRGAMGIDSGGVNYYWTSSEYDKDNAYGYLFSNGHPTVGGKFSTYKVRCMRRS